MIKKVCRIVAIILGSLLSIVFILSMIGTVADAAGLVDDTVKAGNLYSKYPLNNYQLDFFVDSSWGWLPWNWGDGLGKSVMYGLYAITNFIWTVSLYLSNATGYVVQEAYKLDFISDTAESIGKNIQILAGITSNGVQTSGFYFGFLLLMILIVGGYVTYTGLFKRETTKAVRAVINFVVIFLMSGSFIAYAPSYISKINDFSSDVSQAALSLGTKIVVPHSDSKGQDSVDLIRDSLFSIQVEQPWLLLQFDDCNVEKIGEKRVTDILSVSPDEDKGKDRENAVKKEIEDNDNTNLSITKTMNRLGTVVFLFLFNIGISFFVFLLTGIMLFSQILFIIFAMFLPFSFLLSMLPTYESLGKKAIMKLFNTIMMRAGVTLVITTAFSISSMFYNISIGYPFFMIAFLQIVTFAGIYFKLGDIMSMFKLQSNDSQNVSRRIMRKPQTMVNRRIRQLNRNIGRTLSFGGGALVGSSVTKGQGQKNIQQTARSNSGLSKRELSDTNREKDGNTEKTEQQSRSKVMGQKVGRVLDAKETARHKLAQTKEEIKNSPTNLKYGLQQGLDKVKQAPKEFKRGLIQEKDERNQSREKQKNAQQQRFENRKRVVETKNARVRSNIPTNRMNVRSERDPSISKSTPGYQTFKENNDPTKVELSPKRKRPVINKPDQTMTSPVTESRKLIINQKDLKVKKARTNNELRKSVRRPYKSHPSRSGDRK